MSMYGKNFFPIFMIFIVFFNHVSLFNADNQITDKLEIKTSERELITKPYMHTAQDSSISIKTSTNKSWTYMLYLDADNDIEGDAIRDFEWLEAAGGTNEDINIVVLLDRIPGYDNTHGNWNGSRIFNVTNDISPLTFDSQVMVDLGEVDMADPDTLIDFITYCLEYFPAENYILDLWNHGHAAYGVIDDETSSTHFIVDDIQQAINDALATTIEEIDIISMDACNMNTIEVAWEMRNLCSYFISSEEGTNGYPYKSIIEGLKVEPTINASAFCKLIIDKYSIYYSQTGFCLSAINQTKLLEIPDKINPFVTELMTILDTGYYNQLFCLSRDLAFEFYDGFWVDLITLIGNIIDFINKPTLTLLGEELLNLLDEVVAYNWEGYINSNSANGMTIYMPFGVSSIDFFNDYYQGLGFCKDMDWQNYTLWDEFLYYYYINHLSSLVVEPQSLTLGESLDDQVITQNIIKIFRVNIWQRGIYEFSCPITSGDIDFKVIKVDLNAPYVLIGGSYLINPDDGRIEKCRFRLATGFYYILVYGIDTSSNYGIEVIMCDPITLVCNDPYTNSAGSSIGDIKGHFRQDLNYYFQIELPLGNNTIILTSSESANYQLVIYNELWLTDNFLPAAGFGSLITLSYNLTDENLKTIFLEISNIEGNGEFTIEITNPNEPTPKAELQSLFIIIFLPLFIAYFRIKIKNKETIGNIFDE
ncbi:MAG: hypothetical protein FK734_19965 [Asgard group archaeon]|nr:hypothetical protein [Asgard group archaeon]